MTQRQGQRRKKEGQKTKNKIHLINQINKIEINFFVNKTIISYLCFSTLFSF